MSMSRLCRLVGLMTCVGLNRLASALDGRPLCLDGRLPFTTSSSLCPEYAYLGCCTDAIAEQLLERYETVLREMPSADRSKCESSARELICQRCSPYAALLYSQEEARAIADFPVLCPSYVRRLCDLCKPLVRLFAVDDVHSDAFCETFPLINLEFCYPDLLVNEAVRAQLNVSSRECMCQEEFATGLSHPLLLKSPPDDSGRMFVAEREGAVIIYYPNGTRLSEPFMNISDDTLFPSTQPFDDRGFLGLAFHPQFRHNGRFFTYYSVANGKSYAMRLSEFRVSSSDVNRADTSYQKRLLDIDHTFPNNNGGEILFGTDGYLYVFLGDGGGDGDPENNAQNMDSLLGKVLRLDVDTSGPYDWYGVPPDNPFVHQAGANPEIYAYGVRNMWRGDVDEGDPVTGSGRGRIFCADAGENKYEEVNILEKGGNYGWSGKEGFECFKQDVCDKLDNEVLPIFVYNRSMGIATIGGHMYRGCLNPAMMGHFILGDYGGQLFTLTEHPTSGQWTGAPLDLCEKAACEAALLSIYNLRNTLSLGKDADGEIYVLTSKWQNTGHGNIYKLVQPYRRSNPSKCQPKTPVPTAEVPTTPVPDSGEATLPALSLFVICILVTSSLHYH